jgi:C1A family cysteine protease
MLSLAVYVATSTLAVTDYRAEFESFKVKFNRQYTVEEEEQRFAAFVTNLGASLAENAANPEHATQGVTKFMDLTAEEFSSIYLRRKSGNATALRTWNGECTACKRFPEQAALVAAPPAEFDWTTKGAVTPVKDQGQCGSCWSFGTTGDIEGTYFLAGHPLVPLSEQELVSCDTKGEDEGCNGGLQEVAFEFVISNGLTTEAHYPYRSGGGSSGRCQATKERPVAATISSWSQVSKGGILGGGDEDAIKTALLASGPITIGINASPMQRYSRGIDNPLFCAKASLDHAVLIVGYGTENGKDYWRIKNSWNTDWGEDGFYRIVRGSNKCGLANDAVHSVV